MRTKNQQGMTLVEMLVTLAITSIVIVIAAELIDGAMKASQFVESHNDLAAFSQRPMNVIQKEIMQSHTFFTESTDGTAYRQAIEGAIATLTTAPQPVTSLLAVNNNANAFAVDASGTRTAGNALLIARELPPLRIDLGSGVFFNATRYVFEYFYLTQSNVTAQRSYKGSGKIMNLAQAQTEIVADYTQLVNEAGSLSTSQQTVISSALRNAAVTTCRDIAGLKLYVGANDCKIAKAWSPNQPLTSSFYAVPNGNLNWGNVLDSTAAIGLTVRNASVMLPELAGGRISGRMNYTIGFASYQSPRYANAANDPAEKGLEVLIAGPNGFQRVLTRIYMVSEFGVTKSDSQEGFVISQIRGGSVL